MCNDKCATESPPLMAAAGATASGDWTIITRNVVRCVMPASKTCPLKPGWLDTCRDHCRQYEAKKPLATFSPWSRSILFNRGQTSERQQ